jgi:hypothetical protein
MFIERERKRISSPEVPEALGVGGRRRYKHLTPLG